MKSPLKPKRTDFSIKGFLSPDGMKEVADAYRSRLGGPWYPCEPRKPLIACSADTNCPNKYDPNDKTWSGGCLGTCNYG